MELHRTTRVYVLALVLLTTNFVFIGSMSLPELRDGVRKRQFIFRLEETSPNRQEENINIPLSTKSTLDMFWSNYGSRF